MSEAPADQLHLPIEAERGYPPSWQNRHSAAEQEWQRRPTDFDEDSS